MASTTGSLNTETAPPRSRWRKRLAWTAIIVLLVLGLGAWPVYIFVAHQRDLRAAVAEADRLDPGWRFEDLEAARARIPDAENGALRVRAAFRLLPSPWPPPVPAGKGPGIEEALDQPLAPNAPLDENQKAQLRAALAQAAAALPAARQLVDYPRGRYAVAWTEDGIGTLLPHLQELGDINRLLFLDAIGRAQEGDERGAIQSCQAALNAGRSVGDEPAMISQLVRLRCQWRALVALERALCQGEPPEAALENLQRLLEEEASEPLLMLAARAERAFIYQFLEVVRAQKFDRRSVGMVTPYGLPDKVMNYVDAAKANGCEAAYLRYLTEFVEITKLAGAERSRRLEELDRPVFALPQILEMQSRGGRPEGKIGQRFLHYQARLQCAVAALAVERYRQRTGHWPKNLQELVPAYLHKLPTDPVNDAPLGYVPVEDRVVISALESAVSFRLRDAKKRPGGRP